MTFIGDDHVNVYDGTPDPNMSVSASYANRRRVELDRPPISIASSGRTLLSLQEVK